MNEHTVDKIFKPGSLHQDVTDWAQRTLNEIMALYGFTGAYHHKLEILGVNDKGTRVQLTVHRQAIPPGHSEVVSEGAPTLPGIDIHDPFAPSDAKPSKALH